MDMLQSQKNDLRDIRELMEKSTRFLSLSGLSSLSVGIVALLGAVFAFIIPDHNAVKPYGPFYLLYPTKLNGLNADLILTGIIVLALAIVLGFYFSWRKARQKNLPFWNRTAKRTLYFFTVPLIAGGIFTMILILREDFTLVASSTLIFYGLALFSASKYTYGEIQYLGVSEIAMGVLAGIFIQFGLVFWVIGFGILHIVYGIVIYIRYS